MPHAFLTERRVGPLRFQLGRPAIFADRVRPRSIPMSRQPQTGQATSTRLLVPNT